ncbi:MAG: hypothetical protein AMJ88_15690 [Anaerolineae bacterium SM23_ 63]|nr:MAG: hypothetical protein AMJ88_15690 [Anaerolineae bacterium SM23_ 63]
MDEDDLESLGTALVREDFDQGDVILRQGTRAQAMYFIARGEVDVLRKQGEGPVQRLATLEPGDTFGESELIHRQPRIATVRANQPTSVYRWDRSAMSNFMKAHPKALTSLRFSAKSRLLASQLRFRWLAEDEVIYGLSRKHSVLLYEGLTLPIFLLFGASALVWYGLAQGGSLFLWIAGGLALAGVALGVWRWIDWRNDYYIVTDRRVVWLEKIIGIYDSRVESPLHMVLSVSISTDVLGRTFGYGDVIIRTYTGRVIFRNVEDPHAMAALVEEHWQRVRAKKDDTDRETLEHIVKHRLEPETDTLEPEEIEEQVPAPERTAPRPDGLARFGFKVRFEEKGVITYRKHWAVLLREIGLPSMLIMLVVGLLGARLGGLVTVSTLSNFFFFTGAALIPLFSWWIYRYVDWANDIYQITAEQIVDVYKKPLAREMRKVAPLENVLGTEVDRKGLLGIMLNYGDVITNIGTEQFTFEGVFDPIGVQQDIVHAQETFLHRRTDRERSQRRDEMVELLDIYHDQYASRDKERPAKSKG